MRNEHSAQDRDLAENRAGRLSSRQWRRFVGARIAEHALGTVVIWFAFAWIVHTLHLTPSLTVIGIVAALTIIILAALLVYRLRQGWDSVVKAVDGRLTVVEVEVLEGLPLHEIAVGDVSFYVKPSLSARLDAHVAYRAYYLPRSLQVGGNMLLTVEVLAKLE